MGAYPLADRWVCCVLVGLVAGWSLTGRWFTRRVSICCVVRGMPCRIHAAIANAFIGVHLRLQFLSASVSFADMQEPLPMRFMEGVPWLAS